MDNIFEQNNEIYQEPQYIYLIQEREFANSKQNIYKIGRTKQKYNARLNQHPIGSVPRLQTECLNCLESERKIIKIFKKEFKHRKDIGLKYFQGDSRIMSQIIINETMNEQPNNI